MVALNISSVFRQRSAVVIKTPGIAVLTPGMWDANMSFAFIFPGSDHLVYGV
jgi:hypothetical protein